MACRSARPLRAACAPLRPPEPAAGAGLERRRIRGEEQRQGETWDLPLPSHTIRADPPFGDNRSGVHPLSDPFCSISSCARLRCHSCAVLPVSGPRSSSRQLHSPSGRGVDSGREPVCRSGSQGGAVGWASIGARRDADPSDIPPCMVRQWAPVPRCRRLSQRGRRARSPFPRLFTFSLAGRPERRRSHTSGSRKRGRAP